MFAASPVVAMTKVLSCEADLYDPANPQQHDGEREWVQKLKLNTPSVTTLLPVAIEPGFAKAVNEKVPETTVALSAVMLNVPLPCTGLALHSAVESLTSDTTAL